VQVVVVVRRRRWKKTKGQGELGETWRPLIYHLHFRSLPECYRRLRLGLLCRGPGVVMGNQEVVI